MALITCSRCGHEISDNVNYCPHCGKKVKKNFFTKTRVVMGIIGLVAIVAIILSVYSLYLLQTKTSYKVEDAKDEATTVKDIDGNVYKIVKIGNQVWMAENLRTTHYANGESIPLGTNHSNEMPYRYVPAGNNSNVCDHGYLYNWPAVMHGSRSSRRNPSGVQGICPDGWHVPSDAEWTELTDYVGSRSEYSCCGNDNYIAKALSATKGWKTAKEEEWAWSNDTCMVGNDQYTNNSTGFSALPSGNHIGEWYCNFGSHAFFWSTTKSRENKVYYRDIGYEYVLMVRDEDFQFVGYSVRCVRD